MSTRPGHWVRGRWKIEVDMEQDRNAGVARRRRRQRIPAEEIRQRMFDAARRMVYESGVQISLEELSFEEVIQAAGVSRSSAYRIWPYKGDFVQELLCHLAGPQWLGTAAFDQETIDLVE